MLKSVLYFVDFVLAPIVASLVLGINLTEYGISASIFWRMLFGYLGWTFLEFIVHRYLHTSHSQAHLHHHRRPLDYSGPSSFVTWLVFGAFYAGLHFSFGPQWASEVFAGFLYTYTTYLFIHYAIHRFPDASKKFIPRLKAHHDAHHRGRTGTYGVMTIFWDRLFSRKSK